jgi:hypothetical protein
MKEQATPQGNKEDRCVYTCPYCDEVFTDRISADTHIDTSCPKNIPDESVPDAVDNTTKEGEIFHARPNQFVVGKKVDSWFWAEGLSYNMAGLYFNKIFNEKYLKATGSKYEFSEICRDEIEQKCFVDTVNACAEEQNAKIIWDTPVNPSDKLPEDAEQKKERMDKQLLQNILNVDENWNDKLNKEFKAQKMDLRRALSDLQQTYIARYFNNEEPKGEKELRNKVIDDITKLLADSNTEAVNINAPQSKEDAEEKV